MQNGALYQVQIPSHTSQKLQEDLEMLGQTIKDREENIKFLKSQTNSLDESILDMRVKLGRFHSTSAVGMEASMDPSIAQSFQETTESILKQEKSAAAILSQLKTCDSQASEHPLSKHVLGIVGTLCKVEDDNLSRLFSEFLGKEIMLAVVCKKYDDVKALETYDKDGAITAFGLHALGVSSVGRFNVICLERLRPYYGEFIANDPQRRLDLMIPKLPDGKTPSGFMGFGVNMINIDSANLFGLIANGNGLRETLFYTLFSRLQVYKTRADMLQASPCIDHGGISLDGGIIKSPGVFTLGQQEEVEVKFPISPWLTHMPLNYIEIQNRIKKMEWRKERIHEDTMREQSLLEDVKRKFNFKKQEFVTFLATSSGYLNQQQQGQVGGDRMVIN